jgi:D-alanyl-lipoteichoic acid acyltransferase DltB (MBOAT superfamily)
MLFNSYTFIIFLTVVLALHYCPFPWRVKKFNLLWASYLFYAAWNPPFVVLLWISTVADWFIGKWLYKAERPRPRRLLLLASLMVNLGLLSYFKYGGFLLTNFVAMANQFGFDYTPALPSIVLPVGISFYTFQTLSYTLDIYFRKSQPSRSFLDYAMYVTFFPQLVAGPIVRAVDFLPQCLEQRKVSGAQFSWGLFMLVLGLFEKIVIADGLLAPVVERLYDAEGVPDFASAWCGTLAFAGQIFCDFAGYSTCAIGVALCLGFVLPINFRYPYAALGFSDFWRRWHVSLSSWLRDYLYISLGGNRKGSTRTLANLMFTMLVGGLWHGASWTFVVWGGLHGLYLIMERILIGLFGRMGLWQNIWGKALLRLATFALVCVAWVFFRAHTFGQAFNITAAMFGFTRHTSDLHLDFILMGNALVTISAILLVHWLMRDTSLEELSNRILWPLRALVLAAMLVAIATLSGEDRAFIYFQF